MKELSNIKCLLDYARFVEHKGISTMAEQAMGRTNEGFEIPDAQLEHLFAAQGEPVIHTEDEQRER